MAVALAIAADAVATTRGQAGTARPPLQLLFTVDEEEDFGGAAGVDPQHVTGRVLLNLDSENERDVIIGSAGGSRVFLRLDGDWEPAPDGLDCVELRVHGLAGGHSGQQIDQNLMNALKALAYTVTLAFDQDDPVGAVGWRIAEVNGGRADNAIPREARATLLVDTKARAALEAAAARVQREVRAWRAGEDDDAVVELVDGPDAAPSRVMSQAASRRLIDLLVALPSGVVSMDEALPWDRQDVDEPRCRVRRGR